MLSIAIAFFLAAAPMTAQAQEPEVPPSLEAAEQALMEKATSEEPPSDEPSSQDRPDVTTVEAGEPPAQELTGQERIAQAFLNARFLKGGEQHADDPGRRLAESEGRAYVIRSANAAVESSLVLASGRSELGKDVFAIIDRRPNNSLKYIVVLEAGKSNAFVYDHPNAYFDESHLRSKLTMIFPLLESKP